ncbi:transposase [Thermotalea metallivorans]|uniref:Transposase n=1 Tax=Thermotalea metallivorans TaxID=520762 RepID=A0A140L854_9FIRM|nr:transposase [Thermotalea metallivorans]KXG76729.1 hypothetical protein AN619_08790 [Thermotalea metallivorans]
MKKKVVKKRKRYTLEYKLDCIKKVVNGNESAIKVGLKHGISPSLLNRWVREFKKSVVEKKLRGESILKIGQEYEIQPQKICCWVRQYGFQKHKENFFDK